VTDPSLLSDIRSEAERIRTDGTLPVGFEDDMRARFDAIAADPGALDTEVARRASRAAQHAGPGRSAPARSVPRRALGKAARVSKRVAGAGRRRMGPRVRSVERLSVEALGRLSESASTEAQVVSDRARRVVAGSLAERGFARASAARAPHGPAAGTAGLTPKALRLGPGGELGDGEVDRLLIERLGPLRGRSVLHAECGDGSLVRRLRALGVEASGSDARRGEGAERRGALEALAHKQKASLGGIVLSGVTDRVTPSSARAMARLASTRLEGTGVVVVLSRNPAPLNLSDPVAADLSSGRSLHPVTWCHLFARLGFEDITVRESDDGSAYAVAATRPRRTS
jgi:hypothetical protein